MSLSPRLPMKVKIKSTKKNSCIILCSILFDSVTNWKLGKNEGINRTGKYEEIYEMWDKSENKIKWIDHSLWIR